MFRVAEPQASSPCPFSVRDVHVRYAGNAQDALHELCFVVPAGTITGIFGPNGAGKSTVIKAALGLLPYHGDVQFYGQSFMDGRKRIAYIPQRKEIDWNFPVSALDVCLMGLYSEIGFMRPITKKHKDKAMHYLDQVALADFSDRPIGALSGGQQQRVFMARALAQQADLFLLDEPMAGVDQKTETLLFTLFKGMKKKGKTILIVHHNMHKAADHFDHVILLNKTLIAQGTPDEALSPDMINIAYGAVTA